MSGDFASRRAVQAKESPVTQAKENPGSMPLWTSLTVRLALGCLLISGRALGPRQVVAKTKDADITSPAWRTDLRSAIGSTSLPVTLGRKTEPYGRPEPSLWFTDKDRLVVTFVTREDARNRPQLSRRNRQDDAGALRLKAIFLDVNTGQVTNINSWPTQSRMSRIVAVHSDRLLTLDGNGLTLYAPDLSVINSIRLPAPTSFGWRVHTSPTGGNILLSSTELRKGAWIWLETDTLKIVKSWEDAPGGYVTISDGNIAVSTCWWGHDCSYEGAACVPGPKCGPNVEVRSLSTDWRIISKGEQYQRAQFVNQDTIFLPGRGIGKLIRIDGTVLLEESRQRRSWGCWETGALPSADGHRFVIPSCEGKGSVGALDVEGHPVLKQLFVYDIGSHIRTWVLDVKGPRIQKEMQFAISPDGSKLAVLNNEFVEMFDLSPAR